MPPWPPRWRHWPGQARARRRRGVGIAPGQAPGRAGLRPGRYRRSVDAGAGDRCVVRTGGSNAQPRHPPICCAPRTTPGNWRCPIPTTRRPGGGFTVLGMGKLGARELNYSSDIDLVLLFDPAAPIYTERTAGRRHRSDSPPGSRAAWSALMETRDADGYVFRTDLRLRPDPAATPPAIALHDAMTYYESMGQNWERAAMIKARPVAGDLALGPAIPGRDPPVRLAPRPGFRRRRRHPGDEAPDRRAQGRRVGRQAPIRSRGSPATTSNWARAASGRSNSWCRRCNWSGAGAIPACAIAPTLGALRLLARAGHRAAGARRRTGGAYRFLRQVEHRLQMINDRQTHVLPEKPERSGAYRAVPGIFRRAGVRAQALIHQLSRRAGALRARCSRSCLSPLGDTSRRSGTGFPRRRPSPAATIGGPEGNGFRAGRTHRRPRPRLAGRACARPAVEPGARPDGPMLPSILARIGAPAHIRTKRSPGSTAFSARSPPACNCCRCSSAIRRCWTASRRCSARAPSWPITWRRTPRALEGCCRRRTEDVPAALRPGCATRAAWRRRSNSPAERSRSEDFFHVGRDAWRAGIDARRGGAAADGAWRTPRCALLPPVQADFAARFGRVRGGGMAVVAMGKAGGREMMAGSDLDLMFIYDHPADVDRKPGRARACRPASGSSGWRSAMWRR